MPNIYIMPHILDRKISIFYSNWQIYNFYLYVTIFTIEKRKTNTYN